MRRFSNIAAALAIAALLLALGWLYVLGCAPGEKPEPIHNTYWPFTVELAVRDR